MATTRPEPPLFARLAAQPLRWQLLTALAASDLRVRELVDSTGEPQNVVSYHLRLLRESGLVTARRSSADRRDTYYHLDLERCAEELARTGAALHPALRLASLPSPPASSPPVAVLLVCTGNSARSPIAEALLRRHSAGTVQAESAGTVPKPRMHPDAVSVLREEHGIDIGDRAPRHITEVAAGRFDYLVTLCDRAREASAGLPDGPRRVHWSVPDPAAADVSGRAARAAMSDAVADIDARVRHLLPALASDDRKVRT